MNMYAANIGHQDIISGTGWLIKHNPEIVWENYKLKFSRCPNTCKLEEPIKLKSTPTLKTTTRARALKARKIETPLPSELWSEEEDSERNMTGWTYSGLKAARVFFPETKSLYAHLSGLAQDSTPSYSNISQKLAQEALKNLKKKEIKELIPERYHKFLDIFNTKKLERFPQSQP
jgi:hypothetical protein